MLRTQVAIFTLPAILVLGCERAPSAHVTGVATSVTDAAETTASPASERDAQRAAAWAEATHGLAFENERVVVTEPIVGEDVNAFDEAGTNFMKINGRTRAVGAFGKAIRAAPKSADAYRKFGAALTTKGKTDLAIAAYATALDLEPDHLVTRMDRADALDRAGRRAEAIADMEFVLAKQPKTGRAHKRLAVWRYYAGEHAAARRHIDAAAAAGDPAAPQLLGLIEKAELAAGTP